MILKTRSVVGKYVHVLSTDPALEREAPGFADAYRIAMETGALDKLPLKPGERPVVWKFAQLGPDETSWLLDRAARGENGYALDAVALALVEVAGVQTEDGEDLKLTRKSQGRRSGFKAVDADQLAALFTDDEGGYRAKWVSELGNRIAEALLPRNG